MHAYLHRIITLNMPKMVLSQLVPHSAENVITNTYKLTHFTDKFRCCLDKSYRNKKNCFQPQDKSYRNAYRSPLSGQIRLYGYRGVLFVSLCRCVIVGYFRNSCFHCSLLEHYTGAAFLKWCAARVS